MQLPQEYYDSIETKCMTPGAGSAGHNARVEIFRSMRDELQNCGKFPLFEIPVINLESGEQDYIICEITIDPEKGEMYCQRDGVSLEECRSDKIACTKIELDEIFSLDSHLQELYSAVLCDIIDGDLYDLAE